LGGKFGEYSGSERDHFQRKCESPEKKEQDEAGMLGEGERGDFGEERYTWEVEGGGGGNL